MKQLFFFLSCLACFGAQAQYKKLYFDRLTVESGLPQDHVQAHFQDRLGYMWLGTQNGVVRYDGYRTKLYSLPDSAGNPLNLCIIQRIFEDAGGLLWVTIVNEGLFYYDRSSDSFKKIRNTRSLNTTYKKDVVFKGIPDARPGFFWLTSYAAAGVVHIDLYDKQHNAIESFSPKGAGRHFVPIGISFSMEKDLESNIWLAGDSALFLYDPKKNTFDFRAVLPGSESGKLFNDIVPDPVDPDIVWATTLKPKEGGGFVMDTVQAFNNKTKTFRPFVHSEANASSVVNQCSLIIADRQKKLWFFNRNTAALYNRETGKFVSHSFSVPGRTEDIEISSALFDLDNNLWVAGNFEGLFCLNEATKAIVYYPTGGTGAGVLPKMPVDDLFLDSSGGLWVMMSYQGVARLNIQKTFFNTVTVDAPDEKFLENGADNGFRNAFRCNDSTLFVVTAQHLFTWNTNTNGFKIIDTSVYQTADFTDILKDRDGLIWIANLSGVHCFDPVTHRVKHYKADPDDSTTISSNKVHAIVEGNKDTIWVGTWNRGFCSIDKKTGRCTRYPFLRNANYSEGQNVLSDAMIQSLYFDSTVLWVGTNAGGISRYEIGKKTFKNVANLNDGLSCVVSIYKDRLGDLWCGTLVSGLFRINSKTLSYRRYGENDGLCYNGINGVTQDHDGIIWVASNRGLSRLNPETGAITNFTKDNALSENLAAAIWCNKSGSIQVSNRKGVISFDPSQLKKNAISPAIVIETIGYRPSYPTSNAKDTVLFQPDQDGISLQHDENRLSFSYIALHFAAPLLNQYAYRLDGYDKDWIQAGTVRTATYTNLSHGNYVFHVKASNGDGVWNESGARINILIHPPWWQTWWAYTAYFVLAIVGIWAFTSYRSRKLIRDNKLLEHKVQVRTEEVLVQKEEIMAQRDHLEETLGELQQTQKQLIHAEKMASLGELTAGIAHEIQNPLNFVNNFSEVSKELLEEMKTELGHGNNEEAKKIADDIEQNLEKINHHGKRADAIVKGMLQHGRRSSGKKEPTQINELADEYFRLSYHGLRAKDNAFNSAMSADLDPNIGTIDAMAADLGRVFLNLFNNAFYAVAEKKKQAGAGYHPLVQLTTKRIPGWVLVTVKDNGNGIPEPILDKIFQPFFTTKPTNEGTGLGLSLSYDIVKAHGGEIKVETNTGSGTSFIVSLPA